MSRLIIFLFVILLSCESDQESFKTGYTGNPYELIIVSPGNSYESETGNILKRIFHADIFGLPQSEPNFDLIDVNETSFNNLFNSHRNIIHIKVGEEFTEGLTELKKNKYSKGQILIEFSGPDLKSVNKELLDYEEQLLEIFNNAEINRYFLRNQKFGPKSVEKLIQDSLGIFINLQKDAEIQSISKKYVWIRIEKERPVGGYQHQISQGILITRLPYTNRQNFLDSLLLESQINNGKIHIPGPIDGSYMALESTVIPPKISETNFNNQYAKEIRGLWKMKGYPMGGPFYSMVFLDEENDEIIFAQSYVFAPQFDKREYLREVEAMVKSIKLAYHLKD